MLFQVKYEVRNGSGGAKSKLTTLQAMKKYKKPFLIVLFTSWCFNSSGGMALSVYSNELFL